MKPPYFDIYLTKTADTCHFAPSTHSDGSSFFVAAEAVSSQAKEEFTQWLDIAPVTCIHAYATKQATLEQLFDNFEHACRQLLMCSGDAAIVKNNCSAWALKRADQLLASDAAAEPDVVETSFQRTRLPDRPWLCPADPELAAIVPGASLVRVVEMVHVRGDLSLHLGARYVLRRNGTLVTIAASRHSTSVSDEQTSRLPSIDNTFVTRDTPEEWLKLLPLSFTGSRYYATKVFQMDEYAAVRSMLLTPREDKLPAL